MSPPTFPAGRYGRRRERPPPRRWVVVVLGCVVVAATLTLAITAFRRQVPDVHASVRSFDTGARDVRITFDVTKPRNEPATCLVRARDARGAEVGRAHVPVPRAPRRVTVTYTLSTRARPITGEVVRCRLDTG